MALAIAHFAVGFTLGYCYSSRNTTIAWLCGLLALVPDVNQLWPAVDIFLFQSPWSNLFFFHGIYDVGFVDTNPVVGATIVLLAASIIVVGVDNTA